MNIFTINGELNRINFFIRILLIWSAFAVLFYLSSGALEQMLGVKGYLILKSIVEIIIVLLCIPSIIRRLRDINWPVSLSTLFILIGILSIRNFLLFGININPTLFYLISTLDIIAFILLLILIFKKGDNRNENKIHPNNVPQPTAESGG